MPSLIEINLETGKPKGFLLKRQETVVGRDPLCDMLIESQGISRRHARIVFRDESYYIDDLESVNGTYVNRERIRKPTLLCDGDTIHFYRVSGIFRIDGATSGVRPGDSGPVSYTHLTLPTK